MSGFDPDEYLATPAAQVEPDAVRSTSPEAQERAIRAMLAPQVGPGETALMSAVSAVPLGTLLKNFGTTAVLQMLGGGGERASLPEAAQRELAAMGENFERPPGMLDTYRRVRDTDRERLDAGSEQNPNAARAGTAAGIGLSILAPLPGVTVSARGAAAAPRGLARLATLARTPAGARLASSVATGTAYGALSGATDGQADLTRGDIRGVLEDAARGAGTGAAWGAAGGAVAEGARAGIPWLRRLAVRNAKEAIQGQSDIAARSRKPMRDESATLMLDEGHVPPFRNASEIAERIVPAANAEGERLGRMIRDLEARGFTGPNARRVAEQLMDEHRATLRRSSSDEAPANVFRDEADTLVRRLDPGETHLGLSQAEGIKSDIQERAHFAKRESTARETALKNTSRTLRLATEDALRDQAAARAQRAREAGVDDEGRYMGLVDGFINQKERLGRYLDAAQFSDAARSKFDQRPRVGLTDRIEAQKADTFLGSKLLALLASQVRTRGASGTAVGLNNVARSLASGRAAERLGVGGAAFGPLAADEAVRWAEEQDLDDPNLNPKVRALLEMLRRPRPSTEP